MLDIEKEIEEMCGLVDEYSHIELKPNTPEYNFQQSMIANVKRFREAKENDMTTCDHSGATWPTYRKQING